jgi:hypothetical protein
MTTSLDGNAPAPIQGLETLLDGSGQPGLVELRATLAEVLGAGGHGGRLLEALEITPRVHRLRFALTEGNRTVVVKRLDSDIARRCELVATRWLPAAGLAEHGPELLGVAAERAGRCVWHIYEHLGDCTIASADAQQAGSVEPAVQAIAELHTRFAGHRLLPECRLWGGDLGIHFFSSSVRDATIALRAVRPSEGELSGSRRALLRRLLERLATMHGQAEHRARALAAHGSPETLLHGDLWTTNSMVVEADGSKRVRLIDWDHAAVGPVSYDLSTFLLRFPVQQREHVLELYGRAVGEALSLPGRDELNVLFETAELSRLANMIVWPAIAATEGLASWGFAELARVEEWLANLEPVLA